jgi:hypothetical protein
VATEPEKPDLFGPAVTRFNASMREMVYEDAGLGHLVDLHCAVDVPLAQPQEWPDDELGEWAEETGRWDAERERAFLIGALAGAMTAVVALAYNPALRDGLPDDRRETLERELDAVGIGENARRHTTADAYRLWLLDLAADEWETTVRAEVDRFLRRVVRDERTS